MSAVRPLKLRSFADLSPTEFENFSFDILSCSNVHNLTWRTPGPDGGRDIEGEIHHTDFSGFSLRERWYFECKRYSTSLDWPLVYGKIAHADTNGADFLLIITNSTPSPACETQAANWNAARRSPRVRFWRGYELEALATRFPAVAAKYGLRLPPEPLISEFLDISLEISKISQAAHAAVTVGVDPVPAIEASAALSELFSVRAEQVARFGRFVPLPDRMPRHLYPWVEAGHTIELNEIALRACLATFRFVTRAERLVIAFDDWLYSVQPIGHRLTDCRGSASLLLAIVAVWSDFDTTIRDDRVLIIRGRQAPS